MNYLRVPTEISLAEITSKNWCWSPSMFRRVIIPNRNVKPVGDLLASWCNGTEVGSISYVRKCSCNFVRTKALQNHSFLTQPKGDSIIPITPKAFEKATQNHPERIVRDGDILYARGGSVGEVALAYGCGQAVMSGHMLKIVFKVHPFYCFAFMKHPICKLQQEPNLRGAIRALDNFNIRTLLDCLIPLPAQPDASRVVTYVSVLMQAIVEKEKAIREKSQLIHEVIDSELRDNQNSAVFRFTYPSVSELRSLGRMDAVIYDQEYRSKIWMVENYAGGYSTPKEWGFTVTPGPSLEIKILRTRLESNIPKQGFYSLIIPTNISVYGTLNEIIYLGTPRKLPLLTKGDVLFGEAGFHKGRSIVLLDGLAKCTTNAHGLYARHANGDLIKSIFFRCIFDWYRRTRLIDIMAVGGSGGHFSPEYFHYIRLPRFPESKQIEIARLYHNPGSPPSEVPTLQTFVDWQRKWNGRLGIWELDREMSALRRTLVEVQESIILGKTVEIPF